MVSSVKKLLLFGGTGTLTVGIPPLVVAAFLSDAEGVAAGGEAADLSVVSTGSDGTLYWVVTVWPNAPSPAQIVAGQDYLGVAAADSGSQPSGGSGTANASASGLEAETTYYVHWVDLSTAGFSNVASSAAFTTGAAAEEVAVLSAAAAEVLGQSTAALTVSTTGNSGTLYWVVTTTSTSPSAAQVKAGQNHLGAAGADSGSQAVTASGTQSAAADGLTAAATYYVHFVHTNVAGDSNVASSSSFVMEAEPDPEEPPFEGHETPPTTEVIVDDIVIHGNTKPGFIGRFIVPIGDLVAGRTYNVHYVADFSDLALDGAKAGLGFGFKTGNNFRLELIQGFAGSSRLATVTGTPPNGWNKETGHTTTPHGAPTSGTQFEADIRLIVSEDGLTYSVYTSADDQDTWDLELENQPFTPIADETAVTQFGFAGWFSLDDYGEYTITVTWNEVIPTPGPFRYWRINITDNNSATNFARINEMQLHIGANGFGPDQCISGTASADSEFGAPTTFLASNVFDNLYLSNANNQWCSTNTSLPHWVRYDFGAGNEKEVFGVSLFAVANSGGSEHLDSPGAFDIQYSSDGSSWTTYWSVTGATFSPYEGKHFTSPDVTAYTGSPHGAHRYWRMLIPTNDGGTISAASEIEMRATPGGADQCTGGTAFGEDGGFGGAGAVANAFDNNNSTNYFGATSTDNSNIGYDFGSGNDKVVAEITWRNRGDSAANQAPTNIFVQYSDDNTNWTTAWAVIGQTGWTLGQTRTWTDPNYI